MTFVTPCGRVAILFYDLGPAAGSDDVVRAHALHRHLNASVLGDRKMLLANAQRKIASWSSLFIAST